MMAMIHPNGTREKLAEELGIVGWAELQRHFARGVVVVVSPRLDLLEVALALALDNKALVSDWLDTGQVARVSDTLARTWSATRPELQAVVVAPWVVVQELPHGR